MGWFWKGLAYLIIFLLIVRFDISASLYKSEDNRLKMMFPAFLETPLLWVELQVGSPISWDYQHPFADDYLWHLHMGRDDDDMTENIQE